MFFLLRCAFWMGLVFLNMDWTGGDRLLPTAQEVTHEVTREATTRCLSNPEVCAQVVAGAQKLYTASIAERPVHRAKLSADTLSASDRTPAWNGPHP